MSRISSLIFLTMLFGDFLFLISCCSLRCLCVLRVPCLLVVVLVSVVHDQHLSKMCPFLSSPPILSDQAINAGWKLRVYGLGSWPYDQVLGPRPPNVSICSNLLLGGPVSQRHLQSGIMGARLNSPVSRIILPLPLSCAYIWESSLSGPT